jgi:Na+-transporting methylmalonyl-CoA/oxaloacetate decarboxylase gamma subunit
VSPIQWQLLGLAATIVGAIFVVVVLSLLAIAIISVGGRHDPQDR